MVATLQSIFAEHFPAYKAQRKLHPRELNAARCITQCYTPALGCHVLRCPQGHYERIQAHACRHRSCPRCAEPARSSWVQAQQERLLPCAHHHLVFTLPHELLALWEHNRARMIGLLFDSVRNTLLTLLGDDKRLGAMPGILMNLHTWGRNLSAHPHVHCLVTAGGLDAQDAWRASRDPMLLPLGPLKALYRGKLLGWLWKLLKQQRLVLPEHLPAEHWRNTIRELYKKHWNIEISAAYDSARGVALYLAGYVKGGPVPQSRMLLCSEGQVSMPYLDHKTKRTLWLTLSVQEFISRILWHAPPEHVHTTRYAGLYASAHKAQRERALKALHDTAPAAVWPRPQPKAQSNSATTNSATSNSATSNSAVAEQPKCPICSKPLERVLVSRMHQFGENSYRAQANTVPEPHQRGPTIRSSGHSMAGTFGASHFPHGAGH